MDLRAELQAILAAVGPENIWRPVYDLDDELMSDGIADERDGHPRDLFGLDFSGKTVLDLGCNFGYYSFMIQRLGASRVLGVDIDPLVIRGCEILKTMRDARDVEFLTGDLFDLDLPGRYDIVMLINFIGKQLTRQGLQGVLDAVARHSKSHMIISIRHHYFLNKHLSGDVERMARLYAPAYIRNKKLFLLDYVLDYFKDRWDAAVLSPEYEDQSVKRTILFTRKQAAHGISV